MTYKKNKSRNKSCFEERGQTSDYDGYVMTHINNEMFHHWNCTAVFLPESIRKNTSLCETEDQINKVMKSHYMWVTIDLKLSGKVVSIQSHISNLKPVVLKNLASIVRILTIIPI